jgi:hypothetical protein
LEVNQLWQNFSLDVLAQPRLNDFLETVERLPDVKLTAFRQQLGESPVYYESESSIGYYDRKFSDTNTVMADYSAARVDSFHQLLLPYTFFGWLNVTPRVGERLTYYGESSGPGATTTEEYRSVFNTGAEFSFKASRLWRGDDHFLGATQAVELQANPHRPRSRLGEVLAAMSCVRVAVIDCTAMGLPPPMVTFPMRISRV